MNLQPVQAADGRRRVPRWRRLVSCAVLWAAASPSAHSQVVLEGTRVIYPASSREVAVSLTNESDQPVLVQSWIGGEDPAELPEKSSAPFVLDPPLLRLAPGKDNKLRIRALADKVPSEAREHLYWLNVLGAPPKQKASGENQLHLVVRSRYKVLYRPAGLPPPPADRAAGMQVSLQPGPDGRRLLVTNPTPYYLNLGEVKVRAGGADFELTNPAVPPSGSARIRLPAEVSGALESVQVSWIDDYGQLHPVTWPLAGH